LSREYDHTTLMNDMHSLKPHLQYAYSHLYERTLTQIVRDCQYTKQDLDEDLDTKARLDGKYRPTPSTLPNKSPSGTPSSQQNGSLKSPDEDKRDQSSDSDNSNSYTRGTEEGELTTSSMRNSATFTETDTYRMSVARLSDSSPDEYYDLVEPEFIFDEVCHSMPFSNAQHRFQNV
jgi:hypothetical protein